MILLDASGLSASRPGRQLFDDVSLTMSTGDRLALVGINGTGKSTLLRVLAGRDEPETGSVRRGRGTRVVMLDQSDDLPVGTVYEAVAPGGDPDRAWEVDAVLDRLGIADLADRATDQLSGGQSKRVSLARALVELGPGGGPDDDAVLLILDEPTNHLDIAAQLSTLSLLRRLAADGMTVVAALHDLNLAATYCDHVIVMSSARVRAVGAAADILSPELIGEVYAVSADVMTHPRTGRPVIAFSEADVQR